jgi:hypothetical protein
MANLSNLDKIQLFQQIPTSNYWYVNGNGNWAQFPLPPFLPSSVVYISSVSDFTNSTNDIIYFDEGKTYIITTHVDLNGKKIVTNGVCNMLGLSSETTSLTSTGLGVGVPLISSEYTIVIENITIKDVDTGLDIDGNTRPVALDWENVNFSNVPNIGVINTCDNFIMDTCAFLGAQGMKFTGTIGTVGVNNTLLQGLGSSGNIIELDENCIITRRFRIIYSSFVAFGSTIAINVSALAIIPIEAYILDTVNFSGGGTYVSGTNNTSNKSLFINCIGITNTSSLATMYMKLNAIQTVLPLVNQRVAMEGVTEVNGINQRFAHDLSNNALEYTGVISKVFHILATFTIAPAQNNQKYGIYIGVNRGGAIDPDLDRISESEVYINTPQSGRADAASVQALITLNEGDKVYMILQNVSSDANVTVEFLNMVIK